jgi:hypothetical protein
MTLHPCISHDVLARPDGQDRALSVNVSSSSAYMSRFVSEADPGVRPSVTNLMQRAAPSNFAFKWPAGRSPLSGLKPLFPP